MTASKTERISMIGASVAAPPTAVKVAWLLVLSVGVLTLGAKIQVPLWPVPTTLQTLALCLMACYLGPRMAVGGVLAYMAAGFLGAPVFAGAVAGPAYLFGPTAGYLMAFIPAVYVASLLCHRTSTHGMGLFSQCVAFLVLHAVVLAGGTLWLAFAPLEASPLAAAQATTNHDTPMSLATAFAAGCAPFIVGSIMKSALATALIQAQRWGKDWS